MKRWLLGPTKVERLDGGAFRQALARTARAIVSRWREALLFAAVAGAVATSVAISGVRLETLYLERLYQTSNERSQSLLSRAEGPPDVLASRCSGQPENAVDGQGPTFSTLDVIGEGKRQ